jgi:hypothetical protein
MTLYIGDESYAIEGSQPSSKRECVAAGVLTLTVRRVEPLRAQGIGYSLPTIFNELPAVDDTGATSGRLEVHEDDWRRVEFVQRSILDLVTRELDQVRRIYTEHASRDSAGRVIGFTAIHLRNQPAQPLPTPVSLRHLESQLPAASRTYQGFGFRDSGGVVRGGFARDFGPVTLFGRAAGDTITELCLAVPTHREALDIPDVGRAVGAAMAALNLLLVDWIRAQVVEPAAIEDYLAVVGG